MKRKIINQNEFNKIEVNNKNKKLWIVMIIVVLILMILAFAFFSKTNIISIILNGPSPDELDNKYNDIKNGNSVPSRLGSTSFSGSGSGSGSPTGSPSGPIQQNNQQQNPQSSWCSQGNNWYDLEFSPNSEYVICGPISFNENREIEICWASLNDPCYLGYQFTQGNQNVWNITEQNGQTVTNQVRPPPN